MQPVKTQLGFEHIYAPIQKTLPEVEDCIFRILASPNELSTEVIRYFFHAKGKFLRPALCLFGAGMNGRLPREAVQMAAALEVFHSATLIHDDIVDSAYLRRNIPTINTVWGPQVAVLVGDYLHDRAIGAIFGTKSDRAISAFLEMAGQVCDGEILELREKNNFDLKESQYFTIIEKKTAILMSCCLENGAILADLPDAHVAALKRFGIFFGTAFQVVDDCLDFMGEQNEFGKTLGADCAAGVLTLPLIRLISVTGPKLREEIFQMVSADPGGRHLDRLVRLLKEHDALPYSFRKAKELTDRARLELSVLDDCPAKQSLFLLLDYILERHR